MLHEQAHARQDSEEHSHRRYFADEGIDLLVWQREDGTATAFQLTYADGAQSKVLTWTVERGFSHDHLDGGEESPLVNRAPMLIPGATCDIAGLRARFEAAAGALPRDVANFVRGKLGEYRPRAV